MGRRVFARRPNGVLALQPGLIQVNPDQTLTTPIVLADGTTYELERVTDAYILYRELAPKAS